MSSIAIRDLAHSAALDKRAMQAVRGGTLGPNMVPNINVNVNLDQKFAQMQKIDINVLNNNAIIGAGVLSPDMKEAAAFWAAHHAD
ncbi:hypothetical protein ACHMW6_17345 [Pseudoduganella sp. UC29_106]|uniref:hypothetical protein n=1 Tax=Pseudoduganella sp. UC29_106 TaxID=3374553 RepID=UPI003757E924